MYVTFSDILTDLPLFRISITSPPPFYFFSYVFLIIVIIQRNTKSNLRGEILFLINIANYTHKKLYKYIYK